MKDPRKTDLAGLSPADQPIPMRQQIAYAVSEIAVNPIYTITLTFLTFFYTDVLGLNAALVGAIILVSHDDCIYYHQLCYQCNASLYVQ